MVPLVRAKRLTPGCFLRVRITGRIFPVGKKLYLTAKIVSTETSKVQVVAAKGPMEGELDEIVMQLAGKLKETIAAKGAAMLPKPTTKKDVIAIIKKQLGDQKLPIFAVKILEQHMRQSVPDPAAETEINFILKACGAPVISTKDPLLSNWAKEFLKDTGAELPSALSKAEILIVGEGFSEFAGATGKLISCKARLELKAVSAKSGALLATGRATTTAVDLAEGIAAKTALQEAALDIAEKLIPQAVAEYAKEQAAQKKKEQ